MNTCLRRPKRIQPEKSISVLINTNSHINCLIIFMIFVLCNYTDALLKKSHMIDHEAC